MRIALPHRISFMIISGFAEAGVGLSDFEFDVLVRCQPRTATSLALEPARINHQYISRWLRAAERARDDTAQFRAPDDVVSSPRQNKQTLTHLSPVHISTSDLSHSDVRNPQYGTLHLSKFSHSSPNPST
jgi:hypothetical protein